MFNKKSPLPDLLFFLHVMKTGGLSLQFMLKSCFAPEATYPPPGRGDERIVSYISVDRIRQLSDGAKRKIRYLSGHLPHCVGQLFPGSVFYMSFFREPVARTISHLKQARTLDPRFKGMDIVDLYNSRDFFRMYVDNFQTRHFASELTDDLNLAFDPKQLTAEDVSRAREKIAKLDFLGLLEDYDNSIDMLKKQLNLPIKKVLKRRFKYEECEIPAWLPGRIAEDNAIDMETYEFVKKLYGERRRDLLRRAA
jgi:hypothetical protein